MNPSLLEEKFELVTLSSLPSMSHSRMLELLTVFGSPRSALKAIESGEKCGSINSRILDCWSKVLSSRKPEEYVRKIESMGIQTVVFGEESYPYLLSQIRKPPWVLFLRGSLPSAEEPLIAIVGSRKASAYGLEVAEWLARGLAKSGVIVVSGAAYGIDSAAHRGSLQSGGRTIAVLGSGVDVPYPSSNAGLLKEIARNGCVISEYPPGTRPSKQNFPERNRIIAGISLGVVVVEASRRSGALGTVSYALEENREVMAVPGPIFSQNSEGTNELISLGAAAVTCPQDILSFIGFEQEPSTTLSASISSDSKSVLEILSAGGMDSESISRISGMEASRILSILLELEMAGLVRRGPGGFYSATAQAASIIGD